AKENRASSASLWTCTAVPRDWDDVLARAGLRRRGRRRRLLVAAVALGLALVTAPAFALVDGLRDFFVGSRVPGLPRDPPLAPRHASGRFRGIDRLARRAGDAVPALRGRDGRRRVADRHRAHRPPRQPRARRAADRRDARARADRPRAATLAFLVLDPG